MKRLGLFRVFMVLILIGICFSANLSSFAQYEGSSTDVMLQGFHWLSCNGSWWNTINSNASAIQQAGFTIVWLPPVSLAASNEGYLPTQWYNLSSKYGNQTSLQKAINALKSRGIKPIADIVINHRCGSTNWADFTNPSFSNNNTAICRNDEYFSSGNPGAGISQRGANDTGEGYAAARDLDHTNSSVQTEIKNWLNWLKNTIGFQGWRYDFVKGYSGTYVGMYNTATSPYFSVGEYWPTNYFDVNNPNNWRQQIVDWIDATGRKSTAFDFVTKPLLAEAFNNNAYWRLRDSDGKPAGTIGWWPAMSVTFLDNHDTGPSPGGGQNHWPFPSNHVAAGYAYILTHPGIPCVYWPHYFDWGSGLQNEIKNMIALRKAQGIKSTSTVSIQVADNSKYAAIIDNKVAVKIGPGSWSPSGSWNLALSGSNYAIWTKSSGGSAPSAPTGVSANATSSSSITISWNAVSGATSYTVYRSTSRSGSFSSVGTTSSTSFTNTGLSANTTYYYKVTAANSYGTSGYSSTVSATTQSGGGGGGVTTTIRVQYDVGFGNSIYIRGNVSPLSWTQGVAATWTTGNVWVYTTTDIPAGQTFEFKPLINDAIWSTGSNFTGVGGQTITITPNF